MTYLKNRKGKRTIRYQLFKKIVAFNEKWVHFSCFSRKKKFFLLGTIVFCFVLADLTTKYFMVSMLIQPYTGTEILEKDQWLIEFHDATGKEVFITKEIHVISNFWSFVYVRNYNIGFSALRFLEDYFSKAMLKIIFVVLQSCAVFLFVLTFFWKEQRHVLGVACIVSGGFGNIIDRATRGYVVDFVKWYWADSPLALFNPWPIFNLADVFVSSGLAILLWSLLFSHYSRSGASLK